MRHASISSFLLCLATMALLYVAWLLRGTSGDAALVVIVFSILSACGAIWTDAFFRYFVPWEPKPSKFAMIASRIVFVVFVVQGMMYLVQHRK